MATFSTNDKPTPKQSETPYLHPGKHQCKVQWGTTIFIHIPYLLTSDASGCCKLTFLPWHPYNFKAYVLDILVPASWNNQLSLPIPKCMCTWQVKLDSRKQETLIHFNQKFLLLLEPWTFLNESVILSLNWITWTLLAIIRSFNIVLTFNLSILKYCITWTLLGIFQYCIPLSVQQPHERKLCRAEIQDATYRWL